MIKFKKIKLFKLQIIVIKILTMQYKVNNL